MHRQLMDHPRQQRSPPLLPPPRNLMSGLLPLDHQRLEVLPALLLLWESIPQSPAPPKVFVIVGVLVLLLTSGISGWR